MQMREQMDESALPVPLSAEGMPMTRGARVAEVAMVSGLAGVPLVFGAPTLLGPLGIGVPMLLGDHAGLVGCAILFAAGLIPAAYHGWRAVSLSEDRPQARSRKQRDLSFALYMLVGCLGSGSYLATELLGMEHPPGLRNAILTCTSGLVMLALVYAGQARTAGKPPSEPAG